MKKNIWILLFVTFVFCFINSCDNWIDDEIDPDHQNDIQSLELLLPAIQQSMGYNLFGIGSVRVNNIFVQMFVPNTWIMSTNLFYQFPQEYFGSDVLWENIYQDVFMNSKILINEASLCDSMHTAGVGKVLISASLGVLTDLWGDLPFSAALLETNEFVFKPKFDSQEEIYDTIFNLLDQSISNLNSTFGHAGIGADIIYGGDVDKWKKAAYSLKARHKCQLSEVLGNIAYTEALAAINEGFTSNDDDMNVPLGDTKLNPIYQFMWERTDIRMCKTFLDILEAQDDPRIPFYFTKDGDNYSGNEPTQWTHPNSKPGSYGASKDSPARIISYDELKFIEAECHFELGDPINAMTALEEAVSASILKVTGAAVDSTWLANNISNVPISKEHIIVQKYLALYCTNQPYADWRRTGFPSQIIQNINIPIPLRFPYPLSEITFNEENVPKTEISDPVWWDKI